MFLFLFLSNFVLADMPADYEIVVTGNKIDYQVIQIYVDISEVVAPDGSKGTSIPLNTLVSNYAQYYSFLEHKRIPQANTDNYLLAYDWDLQKQVLQKT